MWNGLSIPSRRVFGTDGALVLDATNQRFGACSVLSGRRGLGVKTERPQGREARERTVLMPGWRLLGGVGSATLGVLDHAPGLGGSGNRQNDVRALVAQFG